MGFFKSLFQNPQGFNVYVYNGYLNINGEPMDYDREANVLFWEGSTVLDVKNIEVQVGCVE